MFTDQLSAFIPDHAAVTIIQIYKITLMIHNQDANIQGIKNCI
jgi:hypothetical protein